MVSEELRAIVPVNEFNLDNIAKHFGINMKFKWEDTLVLEGEELKGILRETAGKRVRIFHFGSLVFKNFSNAEITDVVNYLRGIDKNVALANPFEFVDDYRIEVKPDEPLAINNDYMVTAEEQDFHGEIITTVLAKSVALERIEREIDRLLDNAEEVVGFLHKGKLAVSDDQLAKLSARILEFKLNTISYIMLLDKPAITWSNDEAGALYDELSELFELSDRYTNAGHKIDTLLDITEVFGGLAHAKRGAKLEWAVILLITFEILLQLYQFIK